MATMFLSFEVYVYFSRCTRAANSVVGGRVRPKFKLIQDYRVVLVSSKNEEYPFKMKANE